MPRKGNLQVTKRVTITAWLYSSALSSAKQDELHGLICEVVGMDVGPAQYGHLASQAQTKALKRKGDNTVTVDDIREWKADFMSWK